MNRTIPKYRFIIYNISEFIIRKNFNNKFDNKQEDKAEKIHNDKGFSCFNFDITKISKIFEL